MKIATFNVRSLNWIGQLPELTASAIDHHIDIIYVQEHRYLHREDIKYHQRMDVCHGICMEKLYQCSGSGVGMLIRPRALTSLNCIEKIQLRIIVATFNGIPSTTIISCYSPTNVSEETDLIAFYNELSSLVRSIPKHNVLIIGGDMNTQISKNVNNKFILYNSSNRNGKQLSDFTLENGLTCLNTKLQKRKGKRWTYTYANNAKVQID